MLDLSTLTSDERWHFFRRTALASVCLCLVAGLHLFRVLAYDQTRWKGGGFGMFSTVDAENARYLKIFLLSPEEKAIPVRVPDSLFKRGQVLRALPDRSLAEELARRMGELHYYQPDHLWQTTLADLPLPPILSAADLPLPGPMNSEPNGLPVAQSSWVPVPEATDVNAGWRPAAVRVEVWRHVFEGVSKQLRAQKILEVTVAADQAADISAAGGSHE